MKSSDIICPKCRAGYRRIEVAGGQTRGEYRCLLCDHVLEIFDGSTEVGIRLTVQPDKPPVERRPRERHLPLLRVG